MWHFMIESLGIETIMLILSSSIRQPWPTQPPIIEGSSKEGTKKQPETGSVASLPSLGYNSLDKKTKGSHTTSYCVFFFANALMFQPRKTLTWNRRSPWDIRETPRTRAGPATRPTPLIRTDPEVVDKPVQVMSGILQPKIF